MATKFTYPGVYLEEVESAVRPIVGVDTSITAFVGLALEGPRTPTTVNSWTEFDTVFGGVWAGSELSYAVYQFFLNAPPWRSGWPTAGGAMSPSPTRVSPSPGVWPDCATAASRDTSGVTGGYARSLALMATASPPTPSSTCTNA